MDSTLNEIVSPLLKLVYSVLIQTFMWIRKCHLGLHLHCGEWKIGEVSINFGYAIYLIPQQIALRQNQMPEGRQESFCCNLQMDVYIALRIHCALTFRNIFLFIN